MASYSVSVESNGWVLAVRGPWAATAGAFEHAGADRAEGRFMSGGVDQFPLSPDVSPRVQVVVTRQGFTRSGGGVVASVGDSQTLVGLKAIRRPYPNHAQLDETDHGDGTRTVRIALSEYLYAGDTVASVTFAAGWKAGEGAATISGGITNNSTAPLPMAITRWAQPSFELVSGTTSYTVEAIAASHHPRHHGGSLHQALAGMSFMATDGTTTVGPFWALPGASDRGDNVRCWRATLDLTGLTAGPVTIHRTDYPWSGQSRSTGSAHSLDATNANPIGWASPHCISYDPAGALYPRRHVVVDAATGTSTAASVTVATDLAGAKTGTPAADVITAIQALYLANVSLPARNGWAADTARAMDWHVITLLAGVQPFGAGTVTSGANCNEGRLIIRGDPDNADPRANCILRSGTAAPGSRQVARLWLENLTVEQGQASFGTGGMWHLENVEVRGKPGFETGNTTAAFSGSSPAGYANLTFCRSMWWKFDEPPVGSNRRVMLQRSTGVSRVGEAIVYINGWKPVDPYFASRNTASAAAFGTWGVSAFPNSDAMVVGCRADDWAGRFFSAGGAVSGGAGTQADPTTFTRFAIVNGHCERAKGNDSERIWGVGEGSYEQIRDSVFEGCTLIGNGFNGFYNGGTNSSTLSAHADLGHVCNTVRNCVFSRHAIKQDIFKQNGALTGSWNMLFGVGHSGNVHANRVTTDAANFQHAAWGIGAAVNTDYANVLANYYEGFVDDQSDRSVAGTGGGDYRPGGGSVMLARGGPANLDVDVAGNARGAVHASGAFGADAGAVSLLPGGASHAMQADGAVIGWAAGLAGASAVLAVGSTAAAVWSGAMPAAPRSWRTVRVPKDDRTQKVRRD